MSLEANVGRAIFNVFESLKAQLGSTVVEETAGWNLEKEQVKVLIQKLNALVDVNTNRASDTILKHLNK